MLKISTGGKVCSEGEKSVLKDKNLYNRKVSEGVKSLQKEKFLKEEKSQEKINRLSGPFSCF